MWPQGVERWLGPTTRRELAGQEQRAVVVRTVAAHTKGRACSQRAAA